MKSNMLKQEDKVAIVSLSTGFFDEQLCHTLLKSVKQLLNKIMELNNEEKV